MEIEAGNLHDLDTNDTGWFIGFSEWTKIGGIESANLRFMPQEMLSHTIHAKWMVHKTSEDQRGAVKPLSEGRTISILVSETGGFRLQFSPTDQFSAQTTLEQILRRQGDFVIWGGNIYHRYFVDGDCIVFTFRWTPVEPG